MKMGVCSRGNTAKVSKPCRIVRHVFYMLLCGRCPPVKFFTFDSVFKAVIYQVE